jgi:hypothetical protein
LFLGTTTIRREQDYGLVNVRLEEFAGLYFTNLQENAAPHSRMRGIFIRHMAKAKESGNSAYSTAAATVTAARPGRLKYSLGKARS